MYRLLLACLCLLIGSAAFAAKPASPEEEIVYRTNLGRSDDVKLLLSHGISADHTDKKGVPLLALAAARQDEEEGLKIMQVLLDAGANVNAIDKQKQNALFYAARKGNNKAVELLLNARIDYYATDKYGDIARTVAHKAGHHDTVTVMDDFVKKQSADVMKQYEQFNQTVLENQRKQQEALADQARQQEEAAKAAVEAKKNEAAAIEAKTAEELARQEALNKYEEDKARLLREQEDILASRQAPEFEQSIIELAYHNCAYQYWYFGQNARQTMELSDDQVIDALDRHKDQVLSLRRTLIDHYRLAPRYVDRVSVGSKQRIYHDLEKMPSRSYRFEKGFGKVADMEKRCKLIARTWDHADWGRQEKGK